MSDTPTVDPSTDTTPADEAADSVARSTSRPKATQAKVKASAAVTTPLARSPRPVMDPEVQAPTQAGVATTNAAKPGVSTPTAQPTAGSAPGSDILVGELTVQQGGIERATARTIDVHQGGIGRAEATDIAVSQGGIGMARGDRVSVELGGTGLTFARESRITQSFANSVVARDVTIDQGLIQTVIGNRITVNRPTGVLLMLAARVEGDVKPLLDWRGALAAGTVIGVIVGLLRRR
jgi:hypothetical protein